ncbi:NAD(P)-dependent alcohol dehydrogenase [bacterium]|nr:NAD(P)-dependent alcohol dehydrogenase [bacterium]
MKAIVCTRYGSADTLDLREVDQPVPQPDEVLVRVHVATISPADIAARTGQPWFARLAFGLTKPKKTILGSEFSGVVAAVGANVDNFAVSDEVFGASGDDFGCHAEFVCMSKDEAIVPKPSSLSHENAAALSDGSLTALPFLRDLGKISSGQDALINGASGAVGSAAVQLAKHFGAQVTGVCSTVNVEFVTSLGADQVIDYRKEKFTSLSRRYDIVFDTVGKSSFAQSRRVLKPGGIYLRTIPTLAVLLQMLTTKRFGQKKAAIGFMGLRPPHQKIADLRLLAELFEQGVLKPFIGKQFSLDQYVRAHELVESGHKQGNVILTMT